MEKEKKHTIMKTLLKLVLIVAIALATNNCGSKNTSQTANNQPEQVKKKSGQSESSEEEAARLAAYQFVMGIVNENYAEVVELMTLEYFFQLMPGLFGEGIPIDQLFSTEYTHSIVDMRPVVKLGYEVTSIDCSTFDTKSYFREGSKYRSEPAYSVTFDCFDANNKKYDGSHGQYDTDVTVRVVKENGVWKVFEFE